ncbi:MAG: murein biosynthesis integral membrane protein MurJ [Ilumatobacteraceae bacterium]
MDAPRDLLRTNVAVAAGTAVSRVTGLARIVVFGIVIGQTAVADAYDGANNSPNSIYELLIGGVFSAALVPVFTRLFHDDDDDAERAVVSPAIVTLAALTTVAVLCAPFIFRLFSLNPAPGIDADRYRDIGTMLARVFLVQIFFYGLTALATAALNARRKFTAAAWAPVASNIIIVGLLALIPLSIDGRPGLDTIADNSGLRWLLGGGATLGIATTSLIVLLVARAAGLSVGFRPDFRHPAVRRLARLSLWTFGYALTNQVALVVVRNLAEPGSGGPDAYTKAFTFFQLPHALLAASITTTFAPDLARAAASANREAFVARLSLGVRLITMLTLPFAALFFVTSRPMVGALLQHGNFTADAAHTTARALMGFSIGLVGFSVYIFVLRGFYAHEDTRTPFVINCFENAFNVALAFVLVGRYGVLGLGLAFGVAYLVSAVVALVVVERRHPEFASLALMRSLAPMLAATLPAAATAWAIGRAIGATAGIGAVVRTVASFAVGGLVYVASLWILRVRETTEVVEKLRGFSAGR